MNISAWVTQVFICSGGICRPVFTYYPKFGENSRHQVTRLAQICHPIDPGDTMTSCWSHHAPLQELQTVCVHACTPTRLPSQELQATVNREARNIASGTFFKTTWYVKTVGLLDYCTWEIYSYFMDLLCNFLHLKPGHHSLQLFGRLLQCLFPAVFCGKRFTRTSITLKVRR